MNQEKIGKFIALKRKEKNLTQAELAERLGVTDRSISNWENGKNMPDYSLLLQLSKILGISLNDLLSGEKVDEDNYQNKFEENVINLMDYNREELLTKQRKKGIFTLIIGFLITFCAISIFPSESGFASRCSVIGAMLSMTGLAMIIKKLPYFKRLAVLLIYFTLMFGLLFALDYVNVKMNHVAPRFSTNIVTGDTTIYYDTPFYDVYRCNRNSEDEYYVITSNAEIIDDFCSV